MSDIQLAPYIFFQGDCAEAMKFYKEVFGGELSLQKYSEMPDDVPDREKMLDKVMNASLIGGFIDVRGSDTQGASPRSKKVTLCLTGSDETKMRKIFDALSDKA